MPQLSNDREELKTLAEEINLDHGAGEQARRKGLGHFQKAGVALLKAKKLCGHGTWSKWLKANCPAVGERQARRYMELAKTDVTTDLEDDWKRICGNVRDDRQPENDSIPFPEPESEQQASEDQPSEQASSNDKQQSTRRETRQPADDPPFVLMLTSAEEREFKRLVRYLMEDNVFETETVEATVIAALRFAKEYADEV